MFNLLLYRLINNVVSLFEPVMSNTNPRMSANSEAFIAAAKELASFDVDIAFCIEHEFKLSNHSPSTNGINLFNPKTGIKIDEQLNEK